MLAVLASVAGIAISVYLTVVHYSRIPLACPANEIVNYEQVLSWLYAVIVGSVLPTSGAGIVWFSFFFFQAEDGIRDLYVTGVQTCALPIWQQTRPGRRAVSRAQGRFA